MPLGIPRTGAERIARHKSIYGAGTTPPAVRRGLGPSMSTFREALWSWAPSSPVGPDGEFQLPLPRWLTVKIKDSGRRLY